MSTRIKVIGIVMVIGLLLVVMGGVSGSSEKEYEDDQDIQPGPPATVIVTVTQAKTVITTSRYTPPATTPKTTPRTTPTPSITYDGKVHTTGRFGVYNSQGQPVKEYSLSFTAEGQPVSYYEAVLSYVEVYGAKGLKTDFVLYSRTQVINKAGQLVRVAPDSKWYKGDFWMHGHGIDSFTEYRAPKLGRVDLTDHWWGSCSKELKQRVPLAELFKKVGIDTSQVPFASYEFTFIHEAVLETWGENGELFSAVETHKMLLKIDWAQGNYLSIGARSPLGGSSTFLLLLVGVVIIGIYYTKDKKE